MVMVSVETAQTYIHRINGPQSIQAFIDRLSIDRGHSDSNMALEILK